ncbi:MAG: hypothetical protein NC187_08185 [Candidatus Amulumruptor caecigallinarius]|nr:hypothetical protein [Candidatus Amulumruptor caecigallinarius]MCM1397447.1 hypothetical protein [Candidatus Amulumruptor caecigallinarius]MCM1454346.1 hypothetical protein [bacterium]
MRGIYKLSGKETLIRELLLAQVSKRKIARICKVDRNTLDRYLKIFNIQPHCAAVVDV